MELPVDNYTHSGVVTKVVDGDTLQVTIDLGFYASVSERVRLLRINTPEVVGTERAEGLKAKEYVTNLMTGKAVIIRTQKTDSFRRWLADIWFTDDNGNIVNLNDHLVEKGLAKPFMV